MRLLLTHTLAGIALVLAVPLIPLPVVAQDDEIIAAWVQYTAEGIEARAVVRFDCPMLSVDGRRVRMAERASPTSEHPNTVCAAEISRYARSLQLDDRSLPAPTKKRPKRIVIMGDTGCRLSRGHGLYQECNNDSLWPFAQVARSVAAYAPDLILYTGDYIYRESPCPEGNRGCQGSPFGDTQATWEADWLVPARPVHAAAPLVLARGNHETCVRAGKGWFRYLDARPPPPAPGCERSTDPWVVSFPGIQFAVMDTANLKGSGGSSLAGLFADQLSYLDTVLKEPAWIISHRTFWGFGADDNTGELTTPTSQLRAAVNSAGLPREVHFLVGAHIHLAEVLDFGGVRPPQLVAANSGTQLVSRVEPPGDIDGVEIQEHEVLYQYGFVAMEATGKRGWSISFRDIEGRELEKCLLRGKRVRCDDDDDSDEDSEEDSEEDR